MRRLEAIWKHEEILRELGREERLGTGQPGPFIEKEAFEPRQEGGEGASHTGNCGENVSGRGDGH